jgi:hypothetical protein
MFSSHLRIHKWRKGQCLAQEGNCHGCPQRQRQIPRRKRIHPQEEDQEKFKWEHVFGSDTKLLQTQIFSKIDLVLTLL